MQINRLLKVIIFNLLANILLILPSEPAHAAGTPAGTIISNIAVVNYEIAGFPQPNVETPPATFITDRKLDVNVAEADAGRTVVASGDQDTAYKCLGFDVTNEGNDLQDFILSLTNQAGGIDPFGGNDSFNVTTDLTAVVDDGDGICNAADTAAYINDLPSGSTVRVWVKGDIPSAQIEGDISAVTLTARIAESTGTPGVAITDDNSGSADDPFSVDDVFADGTGDIDADNDGKDSDTDSFIVANAVVSLVKSVSILDPFNGSDPIPGAVLTYTLAVKVSGPETALNVVITDPVPVNTTYKPGTLKLDSNELTDESDADAGDVGATTSDTVTVRLGNLTSVSPVHTITFQVTIN